MSRQIEFWFDFSSPYAYFASEAIERIGAETDHTVVWRPFLLGAIFPKTNMAPLADMPMRGRYARHDWDRIARLMGVPFNLPTQHPYAAARVSRAYYWIEAQMPGRAAGFAHAVFRAHFVDGRDPSELSVVADIAKDAGLDRDSVLRAIEETDVKTILRERTDEAIARNIFGSPFFVVDGEAFWGWDRMPMMRQWIERGRW